MPYSGASPLERKIIMFGLLNLGSLILGILAWILPFIFLMGKYDREKWGIISFLSMIASASALFFQIIYSYYLVTIEDWAALLDTQGAVVFAAAVLLSVTV